MLIECYLVSFPGLPHLYLPFVFTIIIEAEVAKWGRPGSIHHVSEHEIDTRLVSGFLTSSFDHTNI